MRPQTQLSPEGDVEKVTGNDLRQLRGFDGDVFLMHGGPPCQSFCPGGKRAALSDPRGNLIYHYLRLIRDIRPRFFLLENVANLLTAAIKHRRIEDRPGKQWNLSRYSEGNAPTEPGMRPLEADEMSGSAIRQILKDMGGLGYQLSLSVLSSADFGAPQKRLRLFLIGSRDNPHVRLPEPTHDEDGAQGRKPWRVLGETIRDLAQDPGPHSEYTDLVAGFFDRVPAGSNWRALPEAVQKEALGKSFYSGGGKTGYFRRLSWEEPAPTIIGRANRKGSSICHPEQTRPLSVRECARIQGFPDDWHFSGSMSSQYQQVGNAVPVLLAQAVGKAILATSRRKPTSKTQPTEARLESELAGAVSALRASARNKRSKKAASKVNQATLGFSNCLR